MQQKEGNSRGEVTDRALTATPLWTPGHDEYSQSAGGTSPRGKFKKAPMGEVVHIVA